MVFKITVGFLLPPVGMKELKTPVGIIFVIMYTHLLASHSLCRVVHLVHIYIYFKL